MSSYQTGKVSICVPTYNRHLLILELIDSILAQTYTNFEIIITDNSDNDLTEKSVFSRYVDSRVKYYKNERNLGMGGNARRAFGFVSGQFFTFTPDDDIWTDREKLRKQISVLSRESDIDIVYSNADSIDYHGVRLPDFFSTYQEIQPENFRRLDGRELLPGAKRTHFLNILTSLLRTDALLEVFRQSFCFESEEYLCYYISSSGRSIGFLYDRTVALREAEHYRTAVEDGVIVDWKKRRDIRIRQIFSIYLTLTGLHPGSKKILEDSGVHSFLGKHILAQAKATGSPFLILQTLCSCYLFFRKFSLFRASRMKYPEGKSFG